jgi:pantothenate kinase-related protein Tda10
MTQLIPAKNMEAVWDIFDPSAEVNTDSALYIQRAEDGLKKLTFDLQHNKRPFHGFICGHVGSGKTTELMRLKADGKVNQLYFPIYISVQEFNIESVNLTHRPTYKPYLTLNRHNHD